MYILFRQNNFIQHQPTTCISHKSKSGRKMFENSLKSSSKIGIGIDISIDFRTKNQLQYFVWSFIFKHFYQETNEIYAIDKKSIIYVSIFTMAIDINFCRFFLDQHNNIHIDTDLSFYQHFCRCTTKIKYIWSHKFYYKKTFTDLKLTKNVINWGFSLRPETQKRSETKFGWYFRSSL